MKKWLAIAILTGFALGIVATYFVKEHYLKVQSDAAHAYAVSLLENNNIDKAIAVLNQAIGINIENYKPYITLGKIYGSEGKTELALESYNKAIELCLTDTPLQRADKKFVQERIEEISKSLTKR